MAITLIIVFFLVLVSLLIAYRLRGKTEKTGLEIFYSLVALLTTFSIIFGVVTFYQQQKLQEENNEIILNNAILEIDWNLNLISSLEEREQQLKEADEGPVNRLEYNFLEESLSIIKQKEIRGQIFIAIKDIRAANHIMDAIATQFFLSSDDTQIEQYKQLKREAVGAILSNSLRIKKELGQIRLEIEDILK